MTDRFDQIEALYHAARERAPEDRQTFLADACRSDDTPRRCRIPPRLQVDLAQRPHSPSGACYEATREAAMAAFAKSWRRE